MVIVFLFLQLEMQMKAPSLCMIEYKCPLIQLRTIVVKFVLRIDKRPDILPIASNIIRKK
jgi:hypothetical protein